MRRRARRQAGRWTGRTDPVEGGKQIAGHHRSVTRLFGLCRDELRRAFRTDTGESADGHGSTATAATAGDRLPADGESLLGGHLGIKSLDLKRNHAVCNSSDPASLGCCGTSTDPSTSSVVPAAPRARRPHSSTTVSQRIRRSGFRGRTYRAPIRSCASGAPRDGQNWAWASSSSERTVRRAIARFARNTRSALCVAGRGSTVRDGRRSSVVRAGDSYPW